MIFRYGNAYEEYPIKKGEVQIIGEHRLMCGNIEFDDMGKLFQGKKATMAYVDPPWSVGNAKAFYTKMGEKREVNFQKFLLKLVTLLKTHVEGDCYVEMGIQNTDVLIDIVQQCGGRVLDKWIIYYGSPKRPNYLVRFTFREQSKMIEDSPSHLLDDDIVEWAILHSSQKGDIVTDLCAGLGMTVRAAQKTNRIAYANEMNPRRIANAIQYLHKNGGHILR